MTLGNNGMGFGGRTGAEKVLFAARTGYERFSFALSLVLKSLIRSAVLTASPPPRCYLSFYVGYFIAVAFGIASDFWLSTQNVIQPTRCYLVFRSLKLLR
ncbi:hypothetical protein CBF17_009730 [Pantoea agglomerans]|nr:hypothetical protein CBF17_009730 [Pantoea agglomerans]